MNEREQKILTTIEQSMTKMTDFQKGYFLGIAEGMAEKHRQNINETQPA